MSRWLTAHLGAEQLINERIFSQEPFIGDYSDIFAQVYNEDLLEQYMQLCITKKTEMCATGVDRIHNQELLKQYGEMALNNDLFITPSLYKVLFKDSVLKEKLFDKYPEYKEINS